MHCGAIVVLTRTGEKRNYGFELVIANTYGLRAPFTPTMNEMDGVMIECVREGVMEPSELIAALDYHGIMSARLDNAKKFFHIPERHKIEVSNADAHLSRTRTRL